MLMHLGFKIYLISLNLVEFVSIWIKLIVKQILQN